MALHATAGEFNFFPFCGLPFILIGLGMLSTPLWSYRKALKTIYAITGQRAIIIEGGRSTTIRSYAAYQLGDIMRREQGNGLGDVILAKRKWRNSDGDSRSEEIGFMRIANAREVERRLRELAE